MQKSPTIAIIAPLVEGLQSKIRERKPPSNSDDIYDSIVADTTNTQLPSVNSPENNTVSVPSTVPVKSNGTIVTCTKMADCTPSKKVIRNRPGEYLLAHLVS